MLHAVGRPLSVSAWLVAPLLFAASVLGLTALGGLLLHASWQVTLSSALWGGAAAVSAALGGAVGWRSSAQRGILAVLYPALLLLWGLALDDVMVPRWWAIGLGMPAMALLLVLCWRRFRPRHDRTVHTRASTVTVPEMR
ncbi:hypothetical protein [Actinokineospora sp.]|uniref:hypothetical protein n=1 Tax=Actinokineospora sp. TaxID=1872133 RepID=UPI004037E8D6